MEIDPRCSDRTTCEHRWQPVSFRFETQLLDVEGRVLVRQPAMDHGRVYVACLLCASHSYMSTRWVGHRMYGSEDESEPGVWDAEPSWEEARTPPVTTRNRRWPWVSPPKP